MLGTIGWFFGSALLTDLIGYWLHRWAHRKGSPLFQAHMTHHLVNYPPKSVVSSSYRPSGSDSLAIWFAPFLLLYLWILWILPGAHFWAAALGSLVVAGLTALVHDFSHISRSFAWQWPFIGVSVRHHAHHFKMRRNFGILFPSWDVIFKTRKV